MYIACNCTLCGQINRVRVFKNGFICEDCIRFVKQNQPSKGAK